MATVLLRISAAMQSWGTQSRFSVRDTQYEPSKSGVVGLIAAAMGINRKDETSLASLADLRFGVRVDREGVLKRDYQTASRVIKASGGIKDTDVSSRYFLANAVFLAALEGPVDLVTRIHTALAHPYWSLYLGRRAFPPGEALFLPDGLRVTESLEFALEHYPRLCSSSPENPCRVLVEDPGGAYIRADQPVSFFTHTYLTRNIKVYQVLPPQTGSE